MSKTQILALIRQNRSVDVPLPEIPDFAGEEADLEKRFIDTLKAAKGYCFDLEKVKDFDHWISTQFPGIHNIVSTVNQIRGNVNLKEIKRPAELKNVDIAVIKADLGVAENGTVWIDEKAAVYRILPFITQHLVVILDRNDIVSNMHLAYKQISIGKSGFGVFVGGPSKTADIEQSLVVGAQGARSHTVLLRGNRS